MCKAGGKRAIDWTKPLPETEKKPKVRNLWNYIFICQNEEQARGWCAALEACCPPLPQRTNAVPLTTMVGQDSSGHLRSPSGKEFVTSGV